MEFLDESIPRLHTRMWRVWKKEGVGGLLLRIDLHTRKYRNWLRWKLDIARSYLNSGYASAYRSLHLYRRPPGVALPAVVDELNVAERSFGVRPNLVFFLYLDMIGDDRRGCRYLARWLNAPWAGILFDPACSDDAESRRPEQFFQCGNARGAAFLNPHCVGPYERLLPDLRFGSVPDVTDAETLPGGSPFGERLRAAAGGRTIVLQMGSLSPHKGTLRFIDVIRRADPQRFFFAIVGEIFWEAFGYDQPDLRRFFDDLPANCLAHIGYIEDARELNSIIAAADILYAVYSGFRPSSNTLTKAAIFQKPVIVSDQYLMGERVRRYDIGAAVGGGNSDEIVAALEALRQRDRSGFGFSAYYRDHSVDALKSDLRSLLRLWLQPSTQGA